MRSPITPDHIKAILFNEVYGEQKEKIIEAINNDEITKGIYLFEKRKYDTERYLGNEMGIGEHFEFEELLTKSQTLKEHYILSKKINESLKVEAFRN